MTSAGPPPSRSAWILLTLSILFLAGSVGQRALLPDIDREAYLQVLVEAGTTGRDVVEVVAGRGYSSSAWAQAAHRHAHDPAVEAALRQRLGQALSGKR